MLATKKVKEIPHLSMQARMKFKSACMHNDWDTFETMLMEAGRMAMNELSGDNYLNPDEFILIKNRNFECVCPYCKGEITLDLSEVDEC